jgi:5-formaminoimidazole-4-carboxamide-1-beta-D-ribofuranosyl 5'-monophosphate synthetase
METTSIPLLLHLHGDNFGSALEANLASHSLHIYTHAYALCFNTFTLSQSNRIMSSHTFPTHHEITISHKTHENISQTIINIIF